MSLVELEMLFNHMYASTPANQLPGLVRFARNIKARLSFLIIAGFQASLRDAMLTINSRTRHSSAPFVVRLAVTYNLQLAVNLGGFKDTKLV
jgi:hypothetical protein